MFFRRDLYPFASAMTFLCLARAMVPRFTLAIFSYLTTLMIGDHPRDRFLITIMNCLHSPQMTFPLGAFLGQYMTLMRLGVFDLARRGFGKPLRRTFNCF
jgi:hypothetical protein